MAKTQKQLSREWYQRVRNSPEKWAERLAAKRARQPQNRKQATRGHKRWVQKNQEHVREYNRKWRERNRHRTLGYKLKKEYGLTVGEFEALKTACDNRCHICDKTLVWRKGPGGAGVDHNHKTKKVRGLLCGTCNRGLGNLKDSVVLLQAAIRYLERNGE